MIPEKSSIPIGEKFLPNVSIEELEKMHRGEKDVRAANRLLAYKLRKEGLSIRGIGNELCRCYSTIRGWLIRAIQIGVEGRYDIKQQGIPERLSSEQKGELAKDLRAGPRECGFLSSTWSGKLVQKHIEKKFNVIFSSRTTVYKIMHEIGFSCKKPRPQHPKSASEEVKNEFKEKVREIIKAHPDHTPITQDESSYIIGWNMSYGWYPVGEPTTAPLVLSRLRFHIFGGLHENGFDFKFYDKANADNFIDFLKYLHKKHGKFIITVDNAAYHKSNKIHEFIESCNGDIIMIYLPPYTPQLNACEGEWRLIKRATSNVLYEDIEEMKNVIRMMLNNGEIGVHKMYEYMLAAA